jgi:hypothetical protein
LPPRNLLEQRDVVVVVDVPDQPGMLVLDLGLALHMGLDRQRPVRLRQGPE